MFKKALYLFSFYLQFFAILSCSKSNILTDEERQWLEDNPELKVAISPKYPPYQFINNNGEIDGIFIDFFTLIEQKINYKFKKVYYEDWQPIMTDAQNGNIDVIVEIQNTKERRSFLNFSAPLFTNPHVIVSKKDTPKGSGIEWFYGKKIAVVNQYAIHEYLKSYHNQLQINPKQNDLKCFESLLSGEVEAYIGQKAIAAYLLDQNVNSNFKIIAETQYINSLGFATRKDLKILSFNL